MGVGKFFLKLSGRRKTFGFSFTLLRFFNSLTFGRLWDFRTNGELDVISLVSKRFPIKVFFDVGANTGEYFLLVSELIKNQEVKFFLFEPDPLTFKTLESSLGKRKNVFLNQIALGKSEETKDYFYQHSIHTLSGFYSKTLGNSQPISVNTISLDYYMSVNKIAKIDFLKIDVEGHEFEILKGASSLIQGGNISFLQFEFGINNLLSRTYFKDFYDLLTPNYNLYLIQVGGLIPIPTYFYELESFGKVCNYFAVNKRIQWP
jgi:FkbM family methyltransferase